MDMYDGFKEKSTIIFLINFILMKGYHWSELQFKLQSSDIYRDADNRLLFPRVSLWLNCTYITFWLAYPV